MQRRSLLTFVALTAPCTAAWSQGDPERPVKLVLPDTAGGNLGVDAAAKSQAGGSTIGLQTVSLARGAGR